MKSLSLIALASAVVLTACGQKEEAAPAPTEAPQAAAFECGNVKIANMNWQSAEVLANVDKMILSEGYGCDVELVPGDTVPTFTSMTEKGQPDLAPEGWISNFRGPVEKAIAEGRLHYTVGPLKDDAVEGWWIPKYVADANPDVKTIDDALKRPDLFPAPEDKNKGAVFNCPSGWGCQITTSQAFKAWGAKDKGFVLVDTGSAAGLDGSIAKAYERKQGWLGYYWGPTAILGKYAMVKLDAGVPVNAEAYANCNSVATCADPVKTDWAPAEVQTVVTDEFKKRAGPVNDYLGQRAWGNDTVNALLAWMTDNQANGEDAARYFLKNQPEVWEAWVTPEVAAKVKAAL